MMYRNNEKINELITKGVRIPNPESVDIGDDVSIEQISGDNVVIHSGCKIYGESTLILHGAQLGYEGPVTVENCQIGPQVNLKGGFFRKAVFLEKASMVAGAHVREGTIFEEGSNAAHNVGLKQTILFPFVTLGSLINFCDCLMSGGTDRKNHSEVGSSYIHFNYTPNQDKATPSLIGDVPKGVMLNQAPIFLGGQGGLVGPCRLAFGTVIAAGSIYRKDELRPGRLLLAGGGKGGSLPFTPGVHSHIKRKVINNIVYIANLMALMQWYVHVRSLFISHDFPEGLFNGLVDKLNMGMDERIRRLGHLGEQMPDSVQTYKNIAKKNASSRLIQQKNEFHEKWPELDDYFKSKRNTDKKPDLMEPFLEKMRIGITGCGKDYISVIKALKSEDSAAGTRWLQGIVDEIVEDMLKIIPSFT
ncbi:hypothetical protein ACFL7E_08345 [Thermodesulfobacteriota bacterium]